MATLRTCCVLLLVLLVPAHARAQEPPPAAPARCEVSLFGEALVYLGGGVRLDATLGRMGPGRVSMGAEFAAGRCGRQCLRIFTELYRPETGQLDPNDGEFELDDLLPNRTGPLPGTPSRVLMPSLRTSYHFDFQHAGLLSLTDVYGLLLLGATRLQATYSDAGVATEHTGWAPTVGAGAGVRQLFGQRVFASLELLVRVGSGTFGTGMTAHDWKAPALGLALGAGVNL